jgi:hypothetical protein
MDAAYLKVFALTPERRQDRLALWMQYHRPWESLDRSELFEFYVLCRVIRAVDNPGDELAPLLDRLARMCRDAVTNAATLPPETKKNIGLSPLA